MLQSVTKIPDRFIAVGGMQRKSPFNDRCSPRRYIRKIGQRAQRILLQPVNGGDGGLPRYGKIYGGTERINIAPGTHISGGKILLRRSIALFENDRCLLAVIVNLLHCGCTKIDQMQTIVQSKDQIVRADVPVDQTLFMYFF